MKGSNELDLLQDKVDRNDASPQERQDFILLLQKAQRHEEIAHYLDWWEAESAKTSPEISQEGSGTPATLKTGNPNDLLKEETHLGVVEDEAARIHRYLGLVEVYVHQLGKFEEAERILRRALDYHPGEPKLLRRLADLLALNRGTYAEAAQLYSQVLQYDPLDESILRMLGRIAGHLHASDRAYGYYSALLALNPQDVEAQRFVGHCRPEEPWILERQVRSLSWTRHITHPDQHGIMDELMQTMTPVLRQVQPGDLTRWGILGEHRLSLTHPQLLPIRFLFDAMDLHSVDTYLWQAGGMGCRFEEFKRPTLLIGSDILSTCHARERSFLIARMTYLYAKGHVLCEKLDVHALASLFASFCCLAGVDGVYGTNAETQVWHTLVDGKIGSDARKGLQALVPIYAGMVDADVVNEWRMATLMTADRVALLLSCDVDEALEALFRYRNIELGKTGRLKLFQNYPPARELFRFAVSEAYFDLRQRLGWTLRLQN
ncbi:MAG: hypothetical protein QGI45_11850 [Myxococcota bacterium]|nr:hypothetical protein [Myxococcota bacterium]